MNCEVPNQSFFVSRLFIRYVIAVEPTLDRDLQLPSNAKR